MLGIVGSTAPHASLVGQEHLTLRADLMLYGDNTEFRNPFREGETIFGAAVRPAAEVALNPRVIVTLGALMNERFGGDAAFELVRPVVSVAFSSPRSTFLIGTLRWPRPLAADGPDRDGPHGLLPPLQRETLTFERPYEAGLQWTVTSSRLRHEAWINWQRLNTSEHRERFDAGMAGEFRAGGAVTVPFQFHLVHEGGQLFASGPVADSYAAALGAMVTRRFSRIERASLEAYTLVSRDVPDREAPRRTTGAGFFGRAAAVARGWRGHLLFWRGDDFIKDEGDPNYLSIRRDGTRYRGVRDYAEAGVARTFEPAPGVVFQASARLHRVEKHYEYSYRLLCVTRLHWQLR
jgi:hypothetical protein